jgi:hypothetical protein
MFRYHRFPIAVTTIYLLVYVLLLQFESTQRYGVFMLIGAPPLVLWMVYTVLANGRFSGRGLGGNEYGYEDRKDLTRQAEAC